MPALRYSFGQLGRDVLGPASNGKPFRLYAAAKRAVRTTRKSQQLARFRCALINIPPAVSTTCMKERQIRRPLTQTSAASKEHR
jgi:hypothetical protein